MDIRRRCDASAAGGALLWAVVVALADVGLVSAAVLFAVLVLVPAALPLAATPRRDGTHGRPFRWATATQPPAAALFAASTVVAAGAGERALAAALALPWVGVSVLVAWHGLRRLAPRGLAPAEEALLDAGLLYLPVGALAALAWRLDLGLGYGLVIVHLTAAHYHYATFLLPVVAAALGRQLRGRRRRRFRWVAAVLVTGVPLIAAGITASPALEAVAAVGFAAGVVGVAALFVRAAVDVAGRDRPAAALLVVAALSAGVTMALAVAFAVGEWVGPSLVSIPTMVRTHGLLNAFGFALPAVLAWRRLAPASRAPPPGVPLDARAGGWRVGADYPERAGLAGEPLAGQVDAVERWAGDRFDPAALDDRVARFFERTVEYRVAHRATWQPPFDRAAGAAMALARRVGQFHLPADGAVHEVVGRCPALAADDPRDAARFWVRTDAATGEAAMVSTYGVHERDGTAYVNVGMPLPGAVLGAVLAPANDGSGLELASRPSTSVDVDGGDAGFYLVVPRVGAVRLPLRERFRVRPADDPGAPEPPDDGDYDLAAGHELWLLGRCVLTVAYGIERDPELAFDDGA